MSNKIGVGITTYNSEGYFKDLYNSLPLDKIDYLVIVNGGKNYMDEYACDKWVQHDTNHGAAKSRNDCLDNLISNDCDYLFIIEDDMIITNPNIFDEYIRHMESSNLDYLCFVSTGDGTGKPCERTPSHILNFKNNTTIHCYDNMCNEFTVRTKSLALKDGYYDESYTMFDVENVYRLSSHERVLPFWCFGDIKDSDNYIQNNPISISRMNPNGERDTKVMIDFDSFEKKHGIRVQQIPRYPDHMIVQRLKPCKIQLNDNFKKAIISEDDKKFDIFIPSLPKDHIKLPYVIDACLEYTTVDNIYVCCPDIPNPLPVNHSKVHWITDDEVFEYPKEKITFRPNWTYQQFLKMFQTISKNDWFLTIDSDAILLKEMPMFDGNFPIWKYGLDQNESQYFNFMRNIFNLEKNVDHTCIGDMGFFNKKIVQSFLDYTNCKNAGELLDKFSFKLNPTFHFSEFEVYGNFVKKYYDIYKFEKLNLKHAGKHLDMGEYNWDVDEIEKEIDDSRGLYDSLHIHSWKV
jgi:hypothetical protein